MVVVRRGSPARGSWLHLTGRYSVSAETEYETEYEHEHEHEYDLGSKHRLPALPAVVTWPRDAGG